MATERQMYLVVNLLEKAKDTSNNIKYYNTNLVFARNGSIIAKCVFQLCLGGVLDHFLQIPQDKSLRRTQFDSRRSQPEGHFQDRFWCDFRRLHLFRHRLRQPRKHCARE
jgi:hypothetical protein